MTEICKPGFRCESCPMNDLPPDEQFTPVFDPETNGVIVRMVGEDAGEVFYTRSRFKQKTRVGYEVQVTIQSDLCGNARAAGAVEDRQVSSLIDKGIDRVEHLVNSRAKSANEARELLLLELGSVGFSEPTQREALATVIMRIAEVR